MTTKSRYKADILIANTAAKDIERIPEEDRRDVLGFLDLLGEMEPAEIAGQAIDDISPESTGTRWLLLKTPKTHYVTLVRSLTPAEKAKFAPGHEAAYLVGGVEPDAVLTGKPYTADRRSLLAKLGIS